VGTPQYSRGVARALECTAAATRPSAARAGLSCAGAYVSADSGSNACPAGSVRIETEAACRIAATAAGKTVDSSSFVQPAPRDPRGCYYTSRNMAYFNPHAVGAGVPGTQLLCAAVTTGAPPPLTYVRNGLVSGPALEGCCMVRGNSWGTHTVLRAPPSAANQPKSFEQLLRDGAGSARQCGALRSLCGTGLFIGVLVGWYEVFTPALVGYSRGTHRVLTGYSPGTHRVLTGTHGVVPGIHTGTRGILKGYSRGTHPVLTGYSRVLMGWYGVFPPALVGCVSHETVLLSTCHAAQGSVLAPWGALFPV
jgi:hypothetical protein